MIDHTYGINQPKILRVKSGKLFYLPVLTYIFEECVLCHEEVLLEHEYFRPDLRLPLRQVSPH